MPDGSAKKESLAGLPCRRDAGRGAESVGGRVKAWEKRNRQGQVRAACMGMEILSRRGNQIRRANDAGGAIQIDFCEFAFGRLHWKNLNMLRGRGQGGYNFA